MAGYAGTTSAGGKATTDAGKNVSTIKDEARKPAEESAGASDDKSAGDVKDKASDSAGSGSGEKSVAPLEEGKAEAEQEDAAQKEEAQSEENDRNPGASTEPSLQERELRAELIQEPLYLAAGERASDGKLVTAANQKDYKSEPFKVVGRFWKSLMGRKAVAGEDAQKWKVTVSGKLPEDVTAQVRYIPLVEGGANKERGLCALELELLDESGEVYVPENPVAVAISGKALKEQLALENAPLVYAWQENKARAEEYLGVYGKKFYAADVTAFKSEEVEKERLFYQPYDEETAYKDGEDAVRYKNDKEGLATSADEGEVRFVYDYLKDAGQKEIAKTASAEAETARGLEEDGKAAALASVAPTARFLLSVQMAEDEAEKKDASEKDAAEKHENADETEKADKEKNDKTARATDKEAKKVKGQILTTGDGKTYRVTVSYGKDAGIPGDAVLMVRNLSRDFLEYSSYVNQAADKLGTERGDLSFARAFDIKLMDPDTGRTYQPDGRVGVSIDLLKEDLGDAEKVSVVHFEKEEGYPASQNVLLAGSTSIGEQAAAEPKAEVLNTGIVDGAVEFQTGSFSVFVVAGYTVDFHWGEYTYSIAGESEIYLSELLENLAENSMKDAERLKALAEDMSQVQKVAFSDPNLVIIEKKSSKQAENDWLLTSLAAFDTEETLTLTMKDGEEMVIRVTDAEVDSNAATANYKVEWSDSNSTTKYYETLSDVAAAVNTNTAAYNYAATVYVQNDVTETGGATFNKNYALTIDGQGHTITSNTGNSTTLITRNLASDFAIRNLILEGTASAFISKNSAGTFTMYDVEMYGGSGAGSLLILNGGGSNRFTKSIFDGGSLGGPMIKDTGTGALIINDCTVDGNESTSHVIEKTGNGSITVSGGKITGSVKENSGSIISKSNTAAAVSLKNVQMIGGCTQSPMISDKGTGALSLANCSTDGNEVTGNLVEKSGNGIMTFSGGNISGSTVSSAGALVAKTATGGTAVTLKKLTLTGGVSSGSLVSDAGTGTLTLTACTFSGNKTTGNLIEKNGNGALNISGGTITGSSVQTDSSLVTKAGTTALTIDGSTLNGNKMTGSMIKDSGTAQLTVKDSTINGPTVAGTNPLLLKSVNGAVSISDTVFTRKATAGAAIKTTGTGAMNLNAVELDGSGTNASEPLVSAGSGALTMSGVTAANHVAQATGVYAVNAGNANSINISGAMTISGNMSGGKPANLYIGDKKISVRDSMSGSLGVSQSTAATAGGQFGTADAEGYAGMDSFVSDSDDSLVGAYQTTGTAAQKRNILWGEPSPAGDDEDDPCCQLVIGSKVIRKYNKLQDAVNAAPNGSRVEMLKDYQIPDEITVNKGKSVTLTTADEYSGTGSAATITRTASLALNKRMFTINNTASSLTVKNLIIDGEKKEVTQPGALFAVTNGKLTLSNGAVLQNGVAANNTGDNGEGGGVYVHGGNSYFTMKDGCLIQSCEARRNAFYAGGGVCVVDSNHFRMEGGTIRNCSAPNKSGGGIGIDHGDTMYITGGLITGCTAKDRGGAIEIHGFVDMSGGTITNCSSEIGGAINFWNNSGNSVTTEAKLFLSGNPVIYDNLDSNNNQRNVDIYNHYNAHNTSISQYNIWLKDYEGLENGAHIGVTAGNGSSGESNVFGHYDSGVDLSHAGLFTNDLDDTLVGSDGGNNNLVWAKGIKIIARMYTKKNPEKIWNIAGAEGRYLFDYEGITSGNRTVTETIETSESNYRTSQGFTPMVDANPEFINAIVNSASGTTSDDVTYLRSKITISGTNRSYVNSFSTVTNISNFYKRYPNYIPDRDFNMLFSSDQVVLYYQIDPKVKITDDEGNILYLPSGNPAVFSKLETAFSKVNNLYKYDEAGKLEQYTESERKIQMLVDEYELRNPIVANGSSKVTLMTAAPDDEDFPGEGGTCTIKNSGIDSDSMITTSLSELVIGNVKIDGNEEETDTNGALIRVKGSGSHLTVREGAVLTGGSCTGNGGAVYAADGTKVKISGGMITGNKAVKGSAVYLANNASAVFSGGKITGNSASAGGAVNVGSPSVTLSFSGEPEIIENTSGSGSSTEEKNIVLDQDTASIIRTVGDGLGNGAEIGVYVDGDEDDDEGVFAHRGESGAVFGSYESSADANLGSFSNDRNGLSAEKGDDDGEIRWTKKNYIARVRTGSESWTYYERLITKAEETGAFNFANTLSGDVIIETLKKGAVEGENDDTKFDGDTVGRYSLEAGFTFNNSQIKSLTIRTKKKSNGVRSVLTKAQTTSTKTPMVIFDMASSKLVIEDLVFEGSGSAQRTSGTGGIVRVTKNNSSMTVRNAVFRNAEASGDGGAIYSAGRVSLVNDRIEDEILFDSNTSTGKFGGAVFAAGALTFTNVHDSNLIEFTSCRVAGGTSSDGGGGAVHCGNLFTINGGTDGSGSEVGNNGKVSFLDCSSTTDGGAASAITGFAANNNRGEILFDNCSTTKTDAVGGALACFNNSGTLSITNIENGTTTFRDCTGATSGGAVAKWYGGTTIITGTAGNPVRFVNCKNTSGDGGAIYHHSGGTATLTNVVFGDEDDSDKACSTKGTGGAVYAAGTLNYIATDGAEIGAYASHANGAGGAFSGGTVNVYTEGTGKILFDACYANGTGGALNGATTSVTNKGSGEILFSDCYAKNDGGAIRTNHINMNDNTGAIRFTRCHTEGGSNIEGGAIFFAGAFRAENNSGSLLFSDCYTTGSSCEGGAIHTEASSATFVLTCTGSGTATFENCRIENASNSGGGAICMWNAGAMTMEGSAENPIQFINCYTNGGPGGAIYHNSTAGLVLKNVIFGEKDDVSKACHAKTEGGAVRTNGALTYTNTSAGEIGVYKSSSTSGAGGAFWAGGNVTVECTEEAGTIVFDTCKTSANNQGGGAIWQNGGSSMALTNVIFGDKDDPDKACVSKGHGGAVRANGSVTYNNTTTEEIGIYNSTTNNYGDGGGIFAQGDVSLTGITIKGCSAKTYGGAVYQNSTAEKPVLYLADCVIEDNNSANLGAGIYSTARNAGFHNFLSIRENTNTQTNVTSAAGLYFTPEDTIIRITGDDGTAEITIYDNKNKNTANGDGQSNLKMGIGAPAIEINGLNADDGLTGRIGIVNPAEIDRWFGRSTSSKVCGEPTIDHGTDGKEVELFKDDSTTFFAKYQGILNRRLIWAPLNGDYVCKITDADGNLLKYDFGDGPADAVFTTLSDAFGALGDYTEDSSSFNGIPAKVKMLALGDSYSLTKIIYVPDNLDITLTTASHEDAEYPGPDDDIAQITRSKFYGSMFVMRGAGGDTNRFTIEKIILDGGGSSYSSSVFNQNGGIIRAEGDGCTLTLGEESLLQNSIITKDGGAVYMAGGSFVMENGAQIQSCNAVNGGGAYAGGTAAFSTEDISDPVRITSCTASGSGGGLYQNGTERLEVKGTVFENCRSTSGTNSGWIGGGGILTKADTVALGGDGANDAVSFVNCTAVAYGGGVLDGNSNAQNQWKSHASSVTTVENVSFQGCKATSYSGGGLYSYAHSLSITDTEFGGKEDAEACTAANVGGAIRYCNTTGTLSLKDSRVENCSAQSNGGAVYYSNILNCTDTEFTSCRSAASGGALFQPSDEGAGLSTLKHCTLEECKAGNTGNGGGLYVSGPSILDDSDITKCEAYSGGAVYSASSNLTLRNGTEITDNKLNSNAGARIQAAGVYMASNSSTVTFGDKDIDGADSVTIKDNYTQTGEPSNLRLAMSGANNTATSVRVLSELSGEIHIVNPGTPGTQFGKDDPKRNYAAPEVFISDFSNRTSGRDTDSPEKLIWIGEAVCKITDSDRNLMHIGGKEAIYATLTEAFSDFGTKSFEEGTPVNIEIFKPITDAKGYEDIGVYMMEAGINVPGKKITLRTAARDAAEHPYPSELTDPCTVLRANTARASSMFTLANASSDLTFADIIIDGQSDKSQFTSSNGGAVFLNKAGAAVTISATAVVRNAESSVAGGGIYRINGGKITLEERTEEQGAPIVACKAANGGGVYDAQTGTADVTNWFIDSCVATSSGGGIYYPNAITVDPGDTTLKLKDCKAANGGGICDPISLNMKGSPLFDGCVATGNGGGVYLPSQHNFYRHSLTGGATFINCTAVNGSGGGLYCYSDDNNSWGRGLTLGGEFVFTDCSAGTSGGGMYKGLGNASYGHLTLNENTRITAKGCHAGKNGGGIDAECVINLNKGVVFLFGGEEDGEACTAGGNGGGFYHGTETINATAADIDFTAIKCTAGGSGGGLFVNNLNAAGADLTLTECTAATNGGGLYANGLLTAGKKLEATDCVATNGTGGGLCVYQTFTANNHPVFRNCTAGTHGGGLALPSQHNFFRHSMTGSATFTDCVAAGGSGGGLYCYSDDDNSWGRGLTLGGEFEFTDCSAGTSGGGMYKGLGNASHGYLTLNENTTITAKNCHAAGGSGGGVYTDCQINMKKGSSILIGGEAEGEACTAGGSGGGFYHGNYSILATEQDIIFRIIKCTCGSNGGGMFVCGMNAGGADITVASCTAGANGGGIYSRDYLTAGRKLEITDCTAEKAMGGGAYVLHTFTANTHPVFTNCTAGTHGGGIALPSEHNFYRHSMNAGADFTDCVATGGSGGGIYCYSDDDNSWGRGLTLDGEFEFTDCSAGGSGGGIYKGRGNANYGYLLFKDNSAISLKKCHADANGGGIFLDTAFNVNNTHKVSFDNCTANNGGGLYANNTVSIASPVEGGASSEYVTTFTDCFAKTNGGGAYFASNSAVTLTEVPFTRCKAGWDGNASVSGGNGGAIYKAANNLTLSNVSISDGYASACGGGIYFAPASTMTLSDGTTITGCTTASGGRGSAIYLNSTGTVNFNGGTDAGDITDPETGDVVGSAPIYGVAITGNRGAGAVEVRNDTGAVLNFGGNVKIQDNFANLSSGENVADIQKNVVLSANSNTIIRTTTAGLSESAYVGVYVIDGANYYNIHGKRAQDFGTYATGSGNANLECFHNDRNGFWGEVDTDKTGSLIRWYGPLVKVTDPEDNLLYYHDNSGDLKPAVLSTLRSGFTTVGKELYYIGGENQYETGAAVKLKLLDDVDIVTTETYTGTRDLTFTTAETETQSYMEPNRDVWLYTGEAKDTDGRAIINRAFNNTMINVNTENSFTAEELFVNGDSGNNRTGRAFQVTKVRTDDGDSSTPDGAIFRNMSFVSCKADSGSAICETSTAPLTIANVQFGALKSEAEEKAPGALKAADVDAGKICWGTSYGGAVYSATTKTATITNCRFYGSKGASGGGIYFAAATNNLTEATFQKDIFINCQATSYHGGAICEFYGDSNRHGMRTTIEESVFTDCSASSWSGAALLRTQHVAIKDTSFTNCYGNSSNLGAVSFLRAEFADVERCKFKDCHIPGNGGAVGNGNGHGTAIRITIAGCEFDNCYSSGNSVGGAVYAETSGLEILTSTAPETKVTAGTAEGKEPGALVSTKFTNCYSGKSGGSVYCTGGPVKIQSAENSEIVFEGSYTKSDNAHGAAICSLNAVDMDDNAGTIRFTGCHTSQYGSDGGAIYVFQSGQTRNLSAVNNSGSILFENCYNTAGYANQGGAIDVVNGSVDMSCSGKGKIRFSDCRTNARNDTYGGGAICVWNPATAHVNIQGTADNPVVFENCYTQSGAGGAIFCRGAVNLTNVRFGGFQLDEEGEVKTDDSGDPVVDAEKACWATGSGGAVYSERNGVSIEHTGSDTVGFLGCKVTDNNAEGGAVHSNGAPVTVTNKAGGRILFDSCTTVRGDGGAISANGQNVSLTNEASGGELLFVSCRQTDENNLVGAGGSICTHQASTFTIQNQASDTRVAFAGCKATRGGAVWTGKFVAENNQGEILFENCTATKNNSSDVYAGGGAVFCNSFTLTNAATGKASLTGCTAKTGNGGALCVNNAQYLGGAITISGTEANPVTFTSCRTDAMNGGAIYQANGANGLALTNVTFNDCQTKNNGGSIYTSGTTKTKSILTNVNVDGCVKEPDDLTKSITNAAKGGAVYLNTGALVVNGGEIRHCLSSDNSGGAVNVGDISARLYFEGDVVIFDNGPADAEGHVTQKNVILDKTHSTQNIVNAIINTTANGLGDDAHIGVFVTGTKEPKDNQTDPYKNHGQDAQPFGTWDATADGNGKLNLDKFTNDRDENLFGTLGNGANTAFIVWGTAGVDVWFMKRDGFGKPLSDATFNLYTDADCETELKKGTVPVKGTSADGTNAYIDKDKNGEVSNRPAGKVLMEKVPNGIYYMKETVTPKKDSKGKAKTYTNSNTYVVLVGTANLLKPTSTAGTPWATVLSNISDSDVKSYTGEGDDKLEFAIFQIEKTKAVTTPDIRAFGIMNMTKEKRRTILRKVATDYSALAGAHFRIFRYDLTEVTEGQPSGKSYYESYDSGVYFIGSMPEGNYYLLETKHPNGAASGNTGKVFLLTVDANGVNQKELGTAGGTLLKDGSSVKRFTGDSAVSDFRKWMKEKAAS